MFKSHKNKNQYLRWLWLSVVVIIIDQISKYLISHYFFLGASYSCTSFFSLVLLHNQGAAFSFLDTMGKTAVWIFSTIGIIAGIGLVMWLVNLPANRKWRACALSLILGGALGNLIDRVVHGYVIDFLLVYYKQYVWPAFNIADSAITVGAVILIIEMFRRKTS